MININLGGKEIAKSVCDLFSPLTEFSGAIGDHIRVYRKLSVLKTLKKAEEIAKERGIELEAPPIKFLIPFLENSSLEEADDNVLIELWAKLLVSSSTDFKREYNLFIRILNELSPIEAKIFNHIANSSIHDSFTGIRIHMEDVATDWDNDFALKRLKDTIAEYKSTPLTEIDYSEFEHRLRSKYQTPGVYIYFLWVTSPLLDDHLYDTPRCEFDDFSDPVAISMLISLGLIKNFQSPDYLFEDVSICIYAYTLTPLGASFYEACINNN